MQMPIVLCPTALLATAVSQAGQGAGQAQGKANGQGKPQEQGQYQGGHDDKDGKSRDNKGQVTSDCNHQANQRNLEGQDRKQFVEWNDCFESHPEQKHQSEKPKDTK